MYTPDKPLHRILRAAVVVGLLASVSCATREFRVTPATPAYLMRGPDGVKTTFPEILRRYNGFEPGRDWMDLRPYMELRIENAYYQPGVSRHGLKGFLGTEVARFKVESNGKLRLVSVKPMKPRPKDQAPVQQLIGAVQRHYSRHRFYYELFFGRESNARSSVLLGADTKEGLDDLAAKLAADPRRFCRDNPIHCTIFPELCTVSIEMQVVVNGVPRNLHWDSDLADVVDHPQRVELLRRYHGRWTPVKLDAHDRGALELPLLPGDRIHWN